MRGEARRFGRNRGARCLALCLLAIGASAFAQDANDPEEDISSIWEQMVQAVQARVDEGPAPLPAPPLAPSVERLLSGALLTDEEKRLARIRHGMWTDDDLTTVAERASVDLVVGNITSEALRDPDAGVLDRAEAAALRGELPEAIEMLAGEGSLRAIRIRAQAFERMGWFEEADAALEPLVRRLVSRDLTSGDELAEGVRALMVRNRVRGPERAGQAGADFETLMSLLGRARNELDRLSWNARLVEAEILWEKDNPNEALAAVLEALALNPRCARAWKLLGEMGVASFDFDRAEAVARRLDLLAEGSVDAAIVRAKGALRRRDPDLATALAVRALRTVPNHRGVLAMRAAAAAVSYQEARVGTLLDEFDALNALGRQDGRPDLDGGRDQAGSAEALLAVGAALAEARQYTQASSYLELAAARHPTLAKPWIELGRLEIQAGRDVRARDALEKAIALDPFNVRARNSLQLVEMIASFEEIESEHFIVRHAPGIDRVLAVEMIPVLEAIHAEVCGPEMFDHEPATKTILELMPDHATFSVRITGMPQVHTMAAATGPVIAMEAPRSGPGMMAGTYDWARTVRHEYIHTVTLSRTRNRIPHWFTEAAAVWGEALPRRADWWGLLAGAYEADELFDIDTISLRFVRPERPTDRTQAYAQGDWMYEYMVERFGVEAPLALMDLYAEGMTEREAMEEVLGETPEDFFEAFKVWARGELVEVGMLLAEGMPRVEELVEPGAELPLDELVALLEAHPEHPDLLRMAVDANLQEADGRPTPDMIPLLERYASACPVDPMPRRHLARLALAGAMDDAPARAIEHLEFLDAREMRSPAYALALAERYAMAGDLDRAWTKAMRARMIAPFDAATREEAARMALLAGNLEAARYELEALMAIEPDRELHKRRIEAIDSMNSQH